MDITSEALDGPLAVVACSGRLNMVTAATLKAHLAQTVTGGRHRVVVDLTGVDFIDSSGLGALIGGLKVARQAGGDLRIACAGAQVTTVLSLTNLDRVLRPYGSVEAANREW